VLQHWQQEWDEFNKRAEEPRQTAEVEQSRIQQLESIIERGLERKRRLEAERQELAALPEDTESGSLAVEITELESELATLKQATGEQSAALDQYRQQLVHCQEELDTATGELQAAQGKQASLEALQQAALGQDNPQVNEWLKGQGYDNQLRLAEGLRIQPGWELAVESVLGDSLQAICVEGLENVANVLSSLPQGKLAFVDVAAVSSSQQALGSLSSLQSKVGSDWNLNGMLEGIFVADSLQDAISHRNSLSQGQSIVTRDGVWLGGSWIQVANISKQDSIVERRGLIAELFKKIKALQEKCNDLQQQRDSLRTHLADTEQARDELQETFASKTQHLGELKSQHSAQLAKIEESETRKQRVAHDLEELSRQLATEEQNTADARARLQQALDSMAEDVGGREKLETARDEVRSELAKCREQSKHNKDLVHELALKRQSLESQLQSTRETMDRMASQVQRSKERMESLNVQIDESDAPLDTMRSELEQRLQTRLEVEKELAAAKARVDENEHKIRALEQSRNEKQEQLNSIRESLMQNKLKSEGATVKREGLLEQLREANFELEKVIAQLPEELTESECEQQLEKVSNRIQRLGPINLAAIDEYQQQSERKVYLDKQNEDLEKALTTLQNAIRKIDKETRARFKETFDKINGGLQSLFPRIFGGGHAYLDMTGEDLLDTGVAIMARPPGKRNSTIHLLSGGEKAMTAIALVFSIFHLNPSPFCMLDEVDAPLDDANVGRYANLVKEMSANVQFIFITHNKITMEMANQLLGVTMHEPGVSRIVAVDIDEAAELAAM
ncbi:MAG: chromosome segregation protein SMC, partial [Pseudomonadales bacterium]|nr:chromosome segregation protein SMC [Pseudomonadales bacterium]